MLINGILHPGMMTTLPHMEDLKRRYSAGEPYTVARVAQMEALINRSDIRLHNPAVDNTTPGGGAELIYCGGNNLGRDGIKVLACDWPVGDGIDAYTFALLGYLLNNSVYSDLAIAYIESWTNAANFMGFDPAGLNAPLQHGWTIPWFANAAEVLRFIYPGWQSRHTAAMDAFIRRMLPLTLNDKVGAPNNWLHSRIEAHVAAGIWLSDKPMLDSALARWITHTPSYIYIASDAGVPVMPASSQIATRGAAYWATPLFVPGLTMETCRDLGHQNLGMRSIFNSLKMAHSQGIDVLTGNDIRERLVTFLEVMPVWTQSGLSNPDGICNQPVVVVPNGRMLADGPVHYPYPIAYELLKSPTTPLLNAKAEVELTHIISASRWVTKWESLMYPR